MDTKKIIIRNFNFIVIVVLLIKILLLFWSAHPFDFWSFVNQFQRSTLYDWNIFEFWNKGNLLIILWYPFYSLYLRILQIFSLNADNVLLLHFIFKVPFLFLDLLCGFLLFRILLKLSGDSYKAKIGFLFWFLNPLVYYTYGIHGHYEILVAFSLVLLVYGILNNNTLVTALSFIISLPTKYFTIIIIPFVVLYLVNNKKIRNLVYLILLIFLGVTISFVHIFLNPEFFNQTANSILFGAKSNAPPFAQEIKIPPTNIVSSIHYLFNPNIPINNINHKFLFSLANYGVLLVAIILLIHLFFRIWSIFLKKREYKIFDVLKDIFLVILYFSIFSTNFQAHYLIWLIPFFIIFSLAYLNSLITTIFLTYTAIGFIFSFRNEFGPRTFFLDILKNFSPYSLSSHDVITTYREGSLIILLLVLSIISLIIFNSSSKDPKNYLKSTKFYFIVIGILWILLILPYILVINQYYKEGEHANRLAYQGGLYHNGIIFGNYKLLNVSTNKILFSNKNQYNSLILTELKTLSTKEKRKFDAYILIINEQNVIKDVLKNARFNNCKPSGVIDQALNYYDGNSYSALKIDINCVMEHENSITYNGSVSISYNDLELYVSNKEVDYLYLESIKSFINFLTLISLIYFFCIIYFSVKILKTLWSYKQ